MSSAFALLCAMLLAGVAAADDIRQQREIFRRVYATVERGDWSAVDRLAPAEQQLLREYALWPDLRAAWFRAAMAKADHAEIEAFLERYGTLRPARELRYRYALHLARADDLAAFLTIYEQFYQGLEIAKLDCLALRAELAAGRAQRITNRAIYLWTVGSSQPEECDPVFSYLADNKLLGVPAFQKRFKLAIEAREFTMASWLGKSIDQKHIDIASQWLRAQRDPESFVRDYRKWPNDESTREQLIYAIERLTYDDPALALELWSKISRGKRFSAEKEYRTSRHIALWLARDNLPGAYAQLAALPVPAQNDEVLRWRARISLRDHEWSRLLHDIELMSEAERDAEEWRYWRGIALLRGGRNVDGESVLAMLAGERSYYGFLAADELGLPYSLRNSDAAADEGVIARLAARPELIRARELYLVGMDGRGRSEWEAVVGPIEPAEKIQAAILAQRWGWHSRAIAAAASVAAFDDLGLRYPLPYAGSFEQCAGAANISPTWAYGVARSESLFMRDVRSSAGAVGLMQLMPDTGRQVASEINLPYNGIDTLTDPEANIRLGTAYLGQMAERYGGNRVLATAAYNAGPQRVDAWLPASGSVDARIWIENIPFNETRRYVRRVLEADTIFHWRMTGETRRLSDELLVVQAMKKTPQVANNQE
jgi:peptidoglycan lytic transglycosylase